MLPGSFAEGPSNIYLVRCFSTGKEGFAGKSRGGLWWCGIRLPGDFASTASRFADRVANGAHLRSGLRSSLPWRSMACLRIFQRSDWYHRGRLHLEARSIDARLYSGQLGVVVSKTDIAECM